MAKGKLSTTCYLSLEPTYYQGELGGFKIIKATARLPKKGHSIKIEVGIPRSTFEPFEAQIDVPASKIRCGVSVSDLDEE